MARGPITVHGVRHFLREEWVRAFRHDHWNIGIADAPIASFLESDASPAVRWLPPPDPGTYRADPFGVMRDGTTVVLFESYDFEKDRGTISWTRELPDGGFSPPRTAFDTGSHASYPFLVESSDSVYCVPEVSRGGEIALYRSVEFPHRWTKAGVLVPGVAGMDNTIAEHDGRLWLFCTDLADGPFSKLRIWHARDLLGPWTPHPRNPVKSDPRSARPAGTPFCVDGELYRPAQDCSSGYGGAVTINRVLELTTTSFREEPVARVGPFREGPYAHGVHTLSALGDRTLVDGKRIAWNRSELARNVRESVSGRWRETLRRG